MAEAKLGWRGEILQLSTFLTDYEVGFFGKFAKGEVVERARDQMVRMSRDTLADSAIQSLAMATLAYCQAKDSHVRVQWWCAVAVIRKAISAEGHLD